jgi:hypothetical protein
VRGRPWPFVLGRVRLKISQKERFMQVAFLQTIDVEQNICDLSCRVSAAIFCVKVKIYFDIGTSIMYRNGSGGFAA